jgi:hypothetical protein
MYFHQIHPSYIRIFKRIFKLKSILYSTDRAPTLKAQSPEFKPQCPQNKQKNFSISYLPEVFSQLLLLLGKNSWHNQLTKRKVLFWFIVWELSVPGCLALLLWACGRQCKAAHLMVKKRKRAEEIRMPQPLSRSHPSDLKTSHQAPPPQGFTRSQWCCSGNKAFNMCDIPDPNNSLR